MDDLISRQMAIHALGEEPEVWTNADEYSKGMLAQWKYDKRAIESLSSLSSGSEQKKGEWIPCSERLPSDKDYDETFTVTIQCEHYDSWDDYVTGYADWTPHGWDIQSYYMGQIKVIAWMPLPEPYKGEKR